VKYNRVLIQADQPQDAFTLDARVQLTQSCTTNELRICVRSGLGSTCFSLLWTHCNTSYTTSCNSTTGWAKQLAQFLYAVTSLNINRFSKFFHCQNQKKICKNTAIFHHTSSVLPHYSASCKRTATRRLVDRAIAQWRRHGRRLECIVQQQGGHIERLM